MIHSMYSADVARSMRRKMMPTRTSTSRLVYNKYDDDQDSNKYFCCCMLISSAHHHHHHRLVLGFAFLFFFLVIAGKIYTTTAAAAESTGGTYFQEHSISKNNHTTPTTTSLAEEDDDNDDGSSRMNRIGAVCSKESIYVFQGPTSPLPNGIPTYTVEIENVCASAGSCSIANIHLSCGWFSSARLINPNVFRRICYDDCLVNNGEALSPGESLSFQYANTFQYPMSVSSVACY